MRSSLFLPALAVSLLPMEARAHDPGFSTAIVTVGAREIEAVVTYSLREIQGDPALPRAAAFQLGEHIPAQPTHDSRGGDENLVYRLVSPRPADGQVILSAPLLEHLAPGHRQHLLVRDEEKAVLLNEFLQRDRSSATVVLPPLPNTESRSQPLAAVAIEIVAIGLVLWLILRDPRIFKSLSSRITQRLELE